MIVLCARAPDSTQIAYYRSRAGPAIVLLHGGDGARLDSHEAGIR